MPHDSRRSAWNVFIVGTLSGMYAAAILGGCGDTKLFRMTAQFTGGTSLTPGSAKEGFQAMPPAELMVILQRDSELLITFRAVGAVPIDGAVPSLQVRCEIDGRSCSNELPDQGVEFLYHDPRGESAVCCPQDSQQWLTPKVPKGFHHVAILGRVDSPQAVIPPIGEWSLIVEAIAH